MKNALLRFAPGILAVLIAAGGGVALTTLAQAQSTPTAPAMPPHPPMGFGGPGERGPGGGHRMMREVERLKTSLKLNASQTALWDRAQGLMKPPTDQREQMKARRDRMAAMLDDPAFDPRRLAAEMDSAEAERKATMTAVRDAWFALYDSLNPAQRGQVREFLRSRMSHRGGMEGPGGGRMEGGWMHRHDGDGPKPPSPPAPK